MFQDSIDGLPGEISSFPGSSEGKVSACNAGDLGSILRSEDPLEKKWQPTPVLGFPCGSAGKESACNAGDLGVQSLGQEDPLE